MAEKTAFPKILYIDDEPEFLRPMIEWNEELGIEFVTATSPEEAHKLLTAGHDFDGIITDIMMAPAQVLDLSFDKTEGGRLAGLRLAEEIKKQDPDLPIIAMSAYTDPTQASSKPSPFDFFINKADFSPDNKIWTNFHQRFLARKLQKSEGWIEEALSQDDLLIYEAKPDLLGVNHDEFIEQRQQIAVSINANLLRVLNGEMERLPELSPREFEEVCALSLGRIGYDVTITVEGPDEGIDLIATSNDGFMRPVYLVQCKRNRIDRKVSVPVLRDLRCVVDDKRASGGIVMTSSYFTSKAQQYAERDQYRMQLFDVLRLKSLIEDGRG